MFDAERPQPIPAQTETLGVLQEELRICLASDDRTLKDCLHRFDLEARTRFKKDGLQQLIARIGTVAASQSNPLAALNRVVGLLASSPNQETTVRGLLLRDNPLDDLLLDFLVWNLISTAKAEDGSSNETLSISPSLTRHLKRLLVERFPTLGLDIWNRATANAKNVKWCEAWSTMTLAILKSSGDLSKRTRNELADRYAEAICQVDADIAPKITPLILYLAGEMGPFSDRVSSVVRTSPVGEVLQRQTQELLGAAPVAQLASNSLPVDSARVRRTNGERGASEFEGLPQPVVLAVKSILSYLRSLYAQISAASAID